MRIRNFFVRKKAGLPLMAFYLLTGAVAKLIARGTSKILKMLRLKKH
ncbi:MAG: hypothetical protein V1661_03105 [bacterium]